MNLHFLFYMLVPMLGILLGLFLFLKPSAAIELQRRFYEKINWRIEPISVEKEIRNTKLMGLFLIVFALLVVAYKILSCLQLPSSLI